MLSQVFLLVAGFGRSILFLRDVILCILRGRIRWNEVFKHIYEQSVQSLFIVILAGIASGAVLAMQARVILENFGAKEFIAQLVTYSLVRELGPVFTALVFSGKSGAGIASELGAMSVNSQIKATRTLGVDPIEFLVVPRVIACMLGLPLLVVVALVVGIWGGFIVSVTEAHVPAAYYISQTIVAFTYEDFFSALVKSVFFSGLIGWVCCYQGFFAKGSSLGVGRCTTHAVALCYVTIIVSNTMLTKIILTVLGR